MKRCEVRRLHLVTYENGMEMQKRLVERRQNHQIPDQLLLLQHFPVITIGRTGKREHLLATEDELAAKGIRFHQTTRGGDITYHGPGQIVGYPIIHLGEGRRDVRRYVDQIEEVIIRTAADYGVVATRDAANRGVWVGSNKLAALGIRIAKWTTSHGFALNITPRLDHFDLITPCGIPGKGVTSLEALAGMALSFEEVNNRLIHHFSEVFEREMIDASHDIEIIKVVVTAADRVLLLRRKEDRGAFWQPVTGRIESGESALNAARRELREETGLEPASIEELPLRQSFTIDPEYLGSDQIAFADERTFHASISDRAVVTLGDEHSGYEWVSRSEALGMIRWTDDREAIERVFENRNQLRPVG